MKRNPVEGILGLLVLVFASAFLFLASAHVDVKTVKGYKLSAAFSKIGGLEMGADVRINGIKVGSVTQIRLDEENYQALVEMTIKENIKLPADTTALIADAGIMGDKYVRLEPGYSDQRLLPGKRITKTKDYKSLEDSVSEFIYLSTKDDVKK